MISQFIDTLIGIGLDPTYIDIMDTLWLASYIGNVDAKESTMLPTDTDMPTSLIEGVSYPNPKPFPDSQRELRTVALKPSLPLSVTTPNLAIPRAEESAQQIAEREEIKLIRTQARNITRTPLAKALSIVRALRPLIRRVSSRKHFILDEEATAKQIAVSKMFMGRGTWLPVLKPTKERWFKLALVIDDSTSMTFWHQTIAELQILLQCQGAFRDVRTWELVTDAKDGEVHIYAEVGLDVRSRKPRNPRELLDPNGQSLILLITDCVSDTWHNGAALDFLSTWTHKHPVVLMQVLPQRLWSRTALGKATYGRFHAPVPGVANRSLQVQVSKHHINEIEMTGQPMPIVSLEPRSLRTWARMVAAMNDSWAPGFVLDQRHLTGSEKSSALLSAVERLRRFRSIASPTAQQLAELLAAAPLSLPIIHLIQRTMLVESGPIHAAEVFLGGLLKRAPVSGGTTTPEYARYDFVDGVRELLLISTPVTNSIQVLKEVYDYISPSLGQSLDIRTLIAHPEYSLEDLQINENSRPFVKVVTKVLQNLGGNYAYLAAQLETATITPPYVNKRINLYQEHWKETSHINYFYRHKKDLSEFEHWIPEDGEKPLNTNYLQAASSIFISVQSPSIGEATEVTSVQSPSIGEATE